MSTRASDWDDYFKSVDRNGLDLEDESPIAWAWDDEGCECGSTYEEIEQNGECFCGQVQQ